MPDCRLPTAARGVPGVPGAPFGTRVARVRQALTEAGLDAVLVVHLPNIFYLTGFGGTGAALVLTLDRLVFITDGRYLTDVESRLSAADLPGAALVPVSRSYDETIAEVLIQTGAGRIGFEAHALTVKRHAWLTAALASGGAGSAGAGAATLVSTDRLVEGFRVRKDAHELAVLRAAGRLLSTVAVDVMARVRVGRSEREIAADVDWAVRTAGFERPAFETIVASGPNSARPHARPQPRLLARGDLVVLDFGGVYDGYCVDLTRTLSVGAPSADAVRWHAAVLAAQEAAIASIRVGVPAGQVDAAARSTLAAHGLADAFGHGTGHGLGIEVHEAPRLSRPPPAAPDPSDRGEPLAPGMVFTIEPGVYFPGRGGVRIEDDVLVTETGCERLTEVARDLMVV